MGKKRRLGKFEAEGQSEKIVIFGMVIESLPFVLMGVIGFLGFLLCIYDIKDDGMFLKIIFKNLDVEFLGSYVGGAITFLAIMFFIFRKPEISAK